MNCALTQSTGLRAKIERVGTNLELKAPVNDSVPGGTHGDKIQALSPQNDFQRALEAQASNMAIDIGKMRGLMFEQGSTSVSMPLLAVLVFWLAIVFASFGLFAPIHLTVLVTYSWVPYWFQVPSS